MINLMVFGLRGSGKDTLVDYLVSQHGYEKLRLAKYVENACYAFGIDKPTKTDLVFVGTEIGRKLINPNVWIDMAVKEIKRKSAFRAEYGFTHDVIVSDVRFHNEYETFLAGGFFPILIESNKELCLQRVKKRDGHVDESLFSHQTETNFKDFFGYKIKNDGHIEEFYAKIDFLMEQLKDKTFYVQQMDTFKELYAGKVDMSE